jgi:alcohol dehydrogenase
MVLRLASRHTPRRGDGMKALVYHGPYDFRLEERPKPQAGPGDVVVKIVLSAICGSELHMLHGRHDARKGVILGHEPVGIVEEIGDRVEGFEVGDRVAISCMTACGRCYYCRRGLYPHCERTGGWVMGYQMDGSHAEYMRVPHAELGLYKVPDQVKTEEVVFVSDALATGYMGAEQGEIEPGDVVVVYGSGPIAVCAMVCAKLWSPSVVVLAGRNEQRLDLAKAMGADQVLSTRDSDPVAFVKGITGGRGADVTIEAVGAPETLTWCLESVRKGGHVSVVGVFDGPVEFPMQRLWEMNISLRTGLTTHTRDRELIDLIAAGKIDLSKLLTNTFPLDQALEAFEVFDKRIGGAMKVGLVP